MIEAKVDPAQLKKIKRQLQNLKKIMGEGSEVLLAMKTWALLVEDSAKRLVNVNTGALRDRINSLFLKKV